MYVHFFKVKLLFFFSFLVRSSSAYFVTVDAHAEECFFDKVRRFYFYWVQSQVKF